MVLDITTTAMPRPEIHETVWQSFMINLQGVEWDKCTLYINIDPLPCACNVTRDPMEVVKVAKKYFGEVCYNITKKGNYSQAYNWIWDNATSEYIINLEDDWQLIHSVHISELIKYFEVNPLLWQVVLRAYQYEYPCHCTSPSILRKEFYKAFAGKLKDDLNPEHQIHHHGERVGLGCLSYKKMGVNPRTRIIAHPLKINKIHKPIVMVKDLGRENIKSLGCKFPDRKKEFVCWESL